MTIDREQILDTFLQIVWAISNKKYQRRVWIKGIGPECNSYGDTVNEFSTTGDAIIEEYKDFGITDEQLNILKKLRDDFSDFYDSYGSGDLPQLFIDSPEWEEVTQMAKKVLLSFNYSRNESSTFEEKRNFILNQFLYSLWNISDIEYQKRVWIVGEGPEVDTFNDTVRCFFDYGKMVFANYQGYGISESQYQILVRFKNAFEEFIIKNHLPQLFINSSDWKRIVQTAKEIISSFNFHKKPKIEEIKYEVNQLLGAILTVSNTQDKERAWVLSENDQRKDFNEIISHFFKIAEPILENYKGFGLSENQYEQLKKLNTTIRGYLNRESFDAWVIEFLQMPEWDQIRDMAKEVLITFNYKPSEIGS